MSKVLLGVNIDHVATLRNARGTTYPEPIQAAEIVANAGADGITIHLREDRRHIVDEDVKKICLAKALPINLEMAATQEMLEIAIKHQPKEVCIVPEKRQELTTEGGLDVVSQQTSLKAYVAQLKAAGILVSLFVDPDIEQIKASAFCGADIVELHTGSYADLALGSGVSSGEYNQELQRLSEAAEYAHSTGMTVNAGHGLTVENVDKVAQLPFMNCLNIGHSIIARAVFVGYAVAIKEIQVSINSA